MAAQGDAVWLCADWIPGSNPNEVEGWLHLAPQIQNRQTGDDSFQLAGKTKRNLLFFGQNQVALLAGWYCWGFGRRESNKVFCYKFARAEKSFAGWLQTAENVNVQIDISSTAIRLIEPDGETAGREIFQWDFATCI